MDKVDTDLQPDDSTRTEDAPAPPDGDAAREQPKADVGNRPLDKSRSRGDADEKERDDKDGAKAPGKKGSHWPLIILAIVVVLTAIGGGVWWYLHRDQTDTDDAYTDGRAVMIASQVGGYVTQLAVNDNQFVHRGDLLVQIDPRPYTATRDQARGQLETAKAQLNNQRIALEKARTSFPAQLAQAQGQLEQAQGTLYNAQADYKRQHAVSRAATSQQSIDQSTANLKSAEGQVQAAQAQVDIAKLIPQNIAQQEAQVNQLEGQVAQAQAALDQAEINLSLTHVTAPQDGWVTRRNVEQGNYLQPGAQIMALVTPDVWVTANFKETQLNRMRPGQRVDLSVDAYPRLDLKGHVDSIQLGSGSKFSAFPAENATGNFVKIVQRVPVKILIDSGLDPNRPLPLGISVVPTVYFK
jgi:membrane fusion protein (multidrug efflux system)